MIMSAVTLANVLRDMLTCVSTGDSLSGNISYERVDSEPGTRVFEVTGSYRIGNSQGQGGMRVFNPTPPADAKL